jgi:hypothetical protein
MAGFTGHRWYGADNFDGWPHPPKLDVVTEEAATYLYYGEGATGLFAKIRN